MSRTLAGQAQIGPYKVIAPLGAGGMGVVSEAIDHDTGDRVALKSLHHLTGASLYRFKNEFRALADLGVDPSFSAYVCGPDAFAALTLDM